MDTDYKPGIELTGQDGNAFEILGKAKKALEKAERSGKVDPGTAQAYYHEATSGDYGHLLKVTMDYCEVS